MRIETKPSALAHGITPTEIRTAINHWVIRTPITARKPGALPVFYTAPIATNQPWIEVIADHADPTTTIVFHAMMLRRSTVTALGIGHLINPEYARQRH